MILLLLLSSLLSSSSLLLLLILLLLMMLHATRGPCHQSNALLLNIDPCSHCGEWRSTNNSQCDFPARAKIIWRDILAPLLVDCLTMTKLNVLSCEFTSHFPVTMALDINTLPLVFTSPFSGRPGNFRYLSYLDSSPNVRPLLMQYGIIFAICAFL